jgi:hypothetical protein
MVICAKQFMNSPPEDVIFWLAQLFLSTTACMLLTNVDDVARTRVMIAGSIVANVVAIPILAYIFHHNLFFGFFLMLFYGTCGAALGAVVLAIGRRAKRSFL